MKLPAFFSSLVFLIFFSCNVDKAHKDKGQSYIITQEDSSAKQRWKDKGMPPPPFLIYGDYNFVVDTSGNVYLHRKSIPLGFYDTAIDTSELASVHLDTSDFVSMSQKDMENFLTNAASNWNTKKSVVIASFSDTIRAGIIYQLIDALKDNGTIRRWNIRKVTKEEATVLTTKNSRR